MNYVLAHRRIFIFVLGNNQMIFLLGPMTNCLLLFILGDVGGLSTDSTSRFKIALGRTLVFYYLAVILLKGVFKLIQYSLFWNSELAI